MSTEGMKDVEVPEEGTVVVQNGEVHEVREFPVVFDRCQCNDGKHARRFWIRGLDFPAPTSASHPIGVQKLELVWEVK